MGLDMYLNASKYVSGYKHSGEAKQTEHRMLANALGIAPYLNADHPSATVEFTVGYWRKANAIHRWFVDNVQNGEDDCRAYEVTREQLMELRALCQKVLDTAQTQPGKMPNGYTLSGGTRTDHFADGQVITNAVTVAAILPTQGGFFFGSTEYNEYYLDDCRDTITQLDRALQIPKDWYFEYRASW